MFRFPLKDVTIIVTQQRQIITYPLYSDEWQQINQHQFSLDVEGVAFYYACNGNYIEVCPYENYNQNELELYLNGSVYGAILHQRLVLPLHGSCFKYKDMGIMLCGDSGAGKSSVTASFSLNGAAFLTDDVSPLLFRTGKPQIWAMSDRIKLWSDSLEQLTQVKNGLHQIDPETEKFYFPMNSDKGKIVPLHQIFLLGIHDEPEVKFREVTGIEKFTALRNEIYRWEYLEGMPKCEKEYFEQITCISKEVRVAKVLRPKEIGIKQFCGYLEKYIYSLEI